MIFKLKNDCKMSSRHLTLNLSKKFPKASIFCSDSSQYLVYKDEVDKAIAWSRWERNFLNILVPRQYKRDEWDCEDYAFCFRSAIRRLYPKFAFGMVFVQIKNEGKHALNCFLDQFGQFHYIEPQNDKWFELDISNYEPYLIII